VSFFRSSFQSSKPKLVSLLPSLSKNKLTSFGFELRFWAFANDTASGIGCNKCNQHLMHTHTQTYKSPEVSQCLWVFRKSDTIESRVSTTSSRSKNRVEVVPLQGCEETINWNAYYTTDWSGQSATNGVVDGGVLMNMLPKDHIYVFQCLQYIHVI